MDRHADIILELRDEKRKLKARLVEAETNAECWEATAQGHFNKLCRQGEQLERRKNQQGTLNILVEAIQELEAKLAEQKRVTAKIRSYCCEIERKIGEIYEVCDRSYSVSLREPDSTKEGS